MSVYSNREFYEMVRAYLLSNEKLRAAQRMYERESVPRLRAQGIPNPRVPNMRTIFAANQRLLDHGQFRTPNHALGSGRPRLTVDVDDTKSKRHPRTSTLKAARRFGISKVKKQVKRAKDGEDEGEGEEEGEEEEEEEGASKPKTEPETEPPVPLPEGKGQPLGHINNVEVSLSRFKTQDQKLLHQYLYGQLCLGRNIKRNIKKFKGYEWAIGSAEYKAKLEETSKMELKQLRTICEMLDLDKKGGPNDLATRIVGFLQHPVVNPPHSRGVARPPPAAVKIQNRGYSDEEYETDPDSKVKQLTSPKDGSEDSDGSFNPSGSEADSDFDPDGGEGVSGAGCKRKSTSSRRSSAKPGKRGRKSKGKKGKQVATNGHGQKAKSYESEKSESESELGESGSDAEESDEPKTKRGRPVAASVAVAAKLKSLPPPDENEASAEPAGRPANGKKTSSEESGEGSEEEDEEEGSEEEDDEEGSEEEDDEEGSEEEDDEEGSEEESGEESDTPAYMKAMRRPTDNEIKKYVKQILKGANLEQTTMKKVCKQVYSHYPNFYLGHKKDFIEAVVKSLISS